MVDRSLSYLSHLPKVNEDVHIYAREPMADMQLETSKTEGKQGCAKQF